MWEERSSVFESRTKMLCRITYHIASVNPATINVLHLLLRPLVQKLIRQRIPIATSINRNTVKKYC